MENLTLAALAQHFANNGPHVALAATISDIPRKSGDEYCPFCLGTNGIKSTMIPVVLPPGVHDASDDFYKCRTCTTIFGENLQDFWRVTDF